MTVKDVAEICKKYNKKLKTISTDDPIPNNGYTLSNQKIKNEGFKFLYKLDTSIKEMIEDDGNEPRIEIIESTPTGGISGWVASQVAERLEARSKKKE